MPDTPRPQYRFGKLPAKHDPRTLRFGAYLTPAVAAPPASLDVLSRVFQQLGTNDVGQLFPLDGNDAHNDCTIAAAAHAVTVFRGLVGTRQVMAEQDVLNLYFQLTGGPNLDTGLLVLDVLSYWKQNAIGGDQILAYTSIDPANHTHVQQAIELFGAVYVGFSVTTETLDQFHAGQPWTPGTPNGEGHAVLAVAYDADGVTVLTWGSLQKGTWAWWDACVDEAFAILPPEARTAGFTPGFDFSQLQSDLASVAS
jgi:hypothetical protein